MSQALPCTCSCHPHLSYTPSAESRTKDLSRALANRVDLMRLNESDNLTDAKGRREIREILRKEVSPLQSVAIV